MADALHVPRARFTSLWSEDTYPLRSSGVFTSIEENLAYICHALESEIDEQRIRKAAQTRYEFTRLALQPKEDVLETLALLKQKGHKIGLISNCAPDVPLLWKTTPL